MQNLSYVRRESPRKSFSESRGVISILNEDPVFTNASRLWGLAPKYAYQAVKQAGMYKTRMAVCFISSLFGKGHFCYERQNYDPTLEGQRRRAVGTFKRIIFDCKPMFLNFAGKDFFQEYPNLIGQPEA